MAEVIEVGPGDTLADLLAALERRDGAATDRVLLWVPRGLKLLRQMEDYQALKEANRRAGVQVKILSPDARIVGMALVFGFDAEIATSPTAVEIHPGHARRARPGTTPFPDLDTPPPAQPAPPARPGPGAAEAAAGDRMAPPPVEAPPAGRPPTVAPPPVAPGQNAFADDDWLFGGGVDLSAILAEPDPTGARSETPPPDVLASLGPSSFVGPAAPPPAPAVSAPPPVAPVADPLPPLPRDLEWLSGAAGLFVPASESPPAPAIPSAPLQPPAPPGPPPAAGDVPPLPSPFTPDAADLPPLGATESLSTWARDDDDAPAMSFTEWLALQARANEGTSGAPPDLDLSNLPAWLRPAPSPDGPPAAPSAPAPVRKPFQPGGTVPAARTVPPLTPVSPLPTVPVEAHKVLHCPHCGADLDPEEMLRLLAQVWGT